MAFATGAVLVLFDSTVVTTNVIAFTFEIARMASSAIDGSALRWCILQMGIRKGIVHGVTVTPATPWVSSVVAWVAPLRTMPENAWRPAVS